MEKTALQMFCEEIERQMTIETFQFYKGLKEKCLEVERKQIIDATNVHKNILISNDIEIAIHQTKTTFGEQYYNDTYGL